MAAGAVWARAQPETPTPPLAAPSATPPAAKATAELDKSLYAPEVWRLPPVSTPESKPALPVALTMPPAEAIPTPLAVPFPPASNAPAALSGKLSGNLSDSQPIDIKPPGTDADKLWDGSFDLGLDGSEGNSETFDFRFGFHAKRKTERNVLSLGLDYNKRTAQTLATANRLFFDGRSEWLIGDSRWSWYLHETVEYDEFQPFDVRDTSDVGVGYRLIKNQTTTLIGRLGGGFSHEYGGPENGLYVPEAVFGVQVEHQLSKRQKLLGSVEYAPDVGDFLRYRIRNQAALEILLDEIRNLSLRMGVLERYNSVPNGAKPNDLDYALMLLWKF